MTMTLDVAIEHLEEMLSDNNREWNCEECRQEHEQLLVRLKELRERRCKRERDENA